MLSALQRTGVWACVISILALSAPVTLAEPAGGHLVDGLTHSRVSDRTEPVRAFGQIPPGCTQPDASTLQAILPIATDHGSHASGVVYATNRVLTAAHAVQGGGQFFVRIDEAFRAAELLMVDHVNDLAVLSVNTQSIIPLHLSGFDPAESQPVWAVGYPRAQAMMTSTGVVQGSREGSLHASASIDLGQSGGGLLVCEDGAWEMLGMLRGYGAYLKDDHYIKLSNHSVSVAATTITEFLRSYR